MPEFMSADPIKVQSNFKRIREEAEAILTGKVAGNDGVGSGATGTISFDI